MKLRGAPLGLLAALLGNLVLGLYARLQQWTQQVLLDDEWHAVHKLLKSGYTDIATSFGIADYSIPLTLLYKAVADVFGLDETLMRLPLMLAGIAAPLLFVAWAWPRWDRLTVALFAWLLATSPMLVFFARTARPYALLALLVPAALWFAWRWWRVGGRANLAGYVVCAALAAWLHLLMAAIVLFPLVWFGLDALAAGGVAALRTVLPRIVRAALALALSLALLLGPPLWSDWAAISAKAGGADFDREMLVESAYLFGGSRHLVVNLAFWLLAAVGVRRLWREQGDATRFVLVTALVFQCALLWSKPAWLQHGLVFVRYNIAWLPLLLLAVAVGVSAATQPLVKHGGLRVLAAAAIGLFLVWGSGASRILTTPTSQGLHSYFMGHMDLAKNRATVVIDKMPVTRFWSAIAPTLVKADETIGLAPWRFETPLSPLPQLERASRRRVLPAFLSGYCEPLRFGETLPAGPVVMKNAVYPGEVQRLADRHVAVIVWQKKWMDDSARVWVMREHGPFAGPLFDPLPRCEAQLRREFGAPVYEDEWLVAFATGARRR